MSWHQANRKVYKGNNINNNMKNKCKLCGHEWESRLECPLACPRCKRYDWKQDKTKEKPKEAF